MPSVGNKGKSRRLVRRIELHQEPGEEIMLKSHQMRDSAMKVRKPWMRGELPRGHQARLGGHLGQLPPHEHDRHGRGC
eukprot:8251558-Prorocentrum_lima.AAC.1